MVSAFHLPPTTYMGLNRATLASVYLLPSGPFWARTFQLSPYASL